jgi:rhodanese-related sulfurtransferase
MPESIALAQLKGLLADGVQLVDVLPPEEYAAEHLPGAVNVPQRVAEVVS